jgi:uncharacterized protein (DUF1015 family)
LLARANRDIEVMRWLIRMATDRKVLTPKQYEHCCMSLNECGRMVGGWAQLAVCLKGIPIEAVEAIARLGSSMPHKSTYFYPKIATGMVLKPLA